MGNKPSVEFAESMRGFGVKVIKLRNLPLAAESDLGLGVIDDSRATVEGEAESLGFAPVRAIVGAAADCCAETTRVWFGSGSGRGVPSCCLLLFGACVDAAGECRLAGAVFVTV